MNNLLLLIFILISPITTIIITTSKTINIYKKSITECQYFYHNQLLHCIKYQFKCNYRYEIIKDQQGPVGSCGIPGPIQ